MQRNGKGAIAASHVSLGSTVGNHREQRANLRTELARKSSALINPFRVFREFPQFARARSDMD